MFESPVDGLRRAVAGVGPIEEREDVSGALRTTGGQYPRVQAQTTQHGINTCHLHNNNT